MVNVSSASVNVMTNCDNCGNKLALIETGTLIISTCLVCAVEFNDVQEITKDGRIKET